jgi:LysR family nitrogen assimilation transcriptional regulator
MQLRNWEYFLQVAEGGSVSRVADKLGISQPALSRQIRALEQDLGVALFRRHGRGLALTAAGEAFRPRAEAILGQISAVADEISAAVDEPKGRLAFGAPSVIGRILTGEAIASFAKQYPLVRLRVRGAHSFQLREALLFRDIDLGVLSTPLAEPELTTEPLVNEQMRLIGPPGTSLGDRPIALDRVAALPLILTPRPDSLRIVIENAFEAIGRVPRVSIESEYAPMDELIRRGLGYAILPGCALANSPLSAGFPSAPIRGLKVTWVLAHLGHSHISLAARKLAAIIRDLARARIATREWRATYIHQPQGS